MTQFTPLHHISSRVLSLFSFWADQWSGFQTGSVCLQREEIKNASQHPWRLKTEQDRERPPLGTLCYSSVTSFSQSDASFLLLLSLDTDSHLFPASSTTIWYWTSGDCWCCRLWLCDCVEFSPPTADSGFPLSPWLSDDSECDTNTQRHLRADWVSERSMSEHTHTLGAKRAWWIIHNLWGHDEFMMTSKHRPTFFDITVCWLFYLNPKKGSHHLMENATLILLWKTLTKYVSLCVI